MRRAPQTRPPAAREKIVTAQKGQRQCFYQMIQINTTKLGPRASPASERIPEVGRTLCAVF